MLGDLLPRESRTITIRARPSGSGAVTTVVAANFASLLTVSTEAIEPRIDLVKTATPDACGSCTDIEWTYSVRNVGTGVARGVVIKDALPEGVRTPDGAREISFAAGDLPGGFTRTFTAILRAERAGSFASEATATDRGGQVVRTPAVGTSVEEPVLSLVAMPSRRATEGTDAEFRFEVANGGGCEVRGAVVRVEIPVGFVLVATTDGGVIEGKSVRWTLESVRPGESIERRITLRGKAPESTSITARLEAACLAERSTRTAVEIVAAPDVP
jgi:hypothetical protein